MTLKLFFVGDELYYVSPAEISVLYEVDTYKRFDWGTVRSALRRGHEITIRPATRGEIRNIEAAVQSRRSIHSPL